MVTVEYDGAGFSGLQYQLGVRTVEGVFRLAVSKFDPEYGFLVFSSRTDSGVHAIGQTALLHTRIAFSERGLVCALNALLPSDIRVLDAVTVASEFHPRGSAVYREYNYFFSRETVPVFYSGRVSRLDYPVGFDFDFVSQLFLGFHDFLAFKRSGGSEKSTFKFVLHSKVIDWRVDDGICGSRFIGKKYVIVSNSFLYRMVRNVVGCIVDCANKRVTCEQISEMLQSGKKIVPFRTAPADGLVLKKVYY